MDEKELAKEIIEEVKDQLRCRADALNLKSTQRAVEKILREHASDSGIEETPKGGIQPFDKRR